MCKGLPASGKSTWAKQQNAKRVNKDDLRDMIDNGNWSKQNEKFIIRVRNLIVATTLKEGLHDVVVDDTNLAPQHEADLRTIAEAHGAEFEIKDFTDVPLQTCLDRDSARPNAVGASVIKKMYRQYLQGKYEPYKAPEHNPDLPDCIIVDIDGTLAHMTGRSPFDYDQVHTDAVDTAVRDIVHKYAFGEEYNPTHIIIVSGRDDTCKDVTEEWLKANAIPYAEIYMRDPNLVDEKGNKLDDTIIKKDIYEEWIKPRFNVKFVLDDRDRVVKMWREQGLKVLQVAEGNF